MCLINALNLVDERWLKKKEKERWLFRVALLAMVFYFQHSTSWGLLWWHIDLKVIVMFVAVHSAKSLDLR
jgi:hypothetical protein